jgi:hypothetical protein
MLRQVNAAFRDQPVEARDAATAEIARMYARLIDNAAPAAKYRKALDWLAQVRTDDEKADEHMAVIAVALAQHSVASDLGPKLLAVLDALQMSPRARNAAKKAVADAVQPDPLDQLAERRAGRRHPTPVDPAAP